MPELLPTFAYLSSYDPPLPIIELAIANPNNQAVTTEVFIFDSGSDMTCIKGNVFDLLKLEYFGYATLAGKTGEEDEYQTAIVRIETPFGVHELTEVVIDSNTDENLLGRDVINKWKVTLDGPNQQMTIEV